MSAEQWKQAITEGIPELEAGEPNRDKALLLHALLGLRRHFELQGETPETASQDQPEAIQINLSEYMEDELVDAEKYLKLWRDTGNADFKDIAKQELAHFEMIAKYVKSVNSGIDLNPYIVHHNALLAKLV